MILGALLLPLAAQATDSTTDPAWPMLKMLVGGAWQGTVGKDTKVSFRFTLQENGKLLRANGVIGVGSLHPLLAESSVGWDPEAKRLYYLDQHGFSTVYWGHVYKQGGETVWDFNALCGDKGHYRSHLIVTPKLYTSTMEEEQEGKWTDLGFHLRLTRK